MHYKINKMEQIGHSITHKRQGEKQKGTQTVGGQLLCET